MYREGSLFELMLYVPAGTKASIQTNYLTYTYIPSYLLVIRTTTTYNFGHNTEKSNSYKIGFIINKG